MKMVFDAISRGSASESESAFCLFDIDSDTDSDPDDLIFVTESTEIW
jgi:hypothetical protein